MRERRYERVAGARVLAATIAAFASLGCSSVELPEQHYYRIRLPAPSGGLAVRAGILRVADPRVAADLAGDRLLVADGPVRVVSYQYHHWAGPLERLVGDALVAGLARAQAFAQVKTDGERGTEDYVLTGRVLDFHQAERDGVWVGEAALALRLCDVRGDALFEAEFRRAVELGGEGPEHLVVALSAALAEIVEDCLRRCAEVGVFDDRIEAEPGR